VAAWPFAGTDRMLSCRNESDHAIRKSFDIGLGLDSAHLQDLLPLFAQTT
jgi:hypothetical protein